MKMSLLHTPEGVRDIYNVECAKKHTLEKRLRALLRLYGYEEIQTPTIEFFDIFNTELASLKNDNLIFINDNNIYLTNRGEEVANIVWERFI